MVEGKGNKVLFIANSVFTISNFRSELISELLELNFSVDIICPENDTLSTSNQTIEKLYQDGVRIHYLKMSRSGVNPFSEVHYFLGLFRIIRKVEPNIILNYTIKPSVYGSLAGVLAGVKAIFSNMTGLGYAFTDSSYKALFIRYVLRLQLRLALSFNNAVFFQNPDDRALIKELYAIPRGVKTVLINGSGVNLKRFSLAENISKYPLSFIFVGRLLKDKGIFEFLAAAKELKNKYPHAIFSVLGSFDENPNSVPEKLIEEYEDHGIINYLGQVSDVVPTFSCYEVMVLPSYREGTPRAVLEAMALEMPIITTDAPGCRETVEDGLNGYLVPIKDIDSLYNAIETFIESPHLIRRMGAESLRLVKERYDVKKVNSTILDTILHCGE